MTLNTPLRPQSVAIILRVMDRAEQVRVSLPSLLNQDYPDYQVIIVDHCSEDGLPAVLETFQHPRLRVVRCPRPIFFNPSSSGNTGARYSFSDLLFFLDTGMTFRDEKHLSEIVAAFQSSPEIDYRHYERWRNGAGFPSLEAARMPKEESGRRVYCECECHGLHTLVSRDIFQRIGGLNEALLDWGYEDTDLTTRLELCGYGRIPIRELNESVHSDELRVRFFEVKSKERSWTKNRIISDGFIRTFGPVLRTQRKPGFCEWVEIDGVRHAGAEAPQQEWSIPTAGDLLSPPAFHARRPDTREAAPLVSVVVPTKNAAEYLVVVLDSILSQDYPNIECIVADGGSTDATLDILASYGDRLTVIAQRDRGAFDAINRAWQASRGQILAWLNIDDGWAPGAVSAAVKCFQNDPGADVVYGDCLIVDAEGRELDRRRPPSWDLAYAVEHCHHIIDQPAAFIRRDMVERIGWLYPAWFHDWDLWRRISLAGGKIKRVPDLLGYQRVRKDNSQYKPEILIGGMVAMTRRFFSLPGVSAGLQELRPRAISNCYLKIVQTLQYGRPESRGLRLWLCVKATAADPSNFSNILRTTPAGRRRLFAPEEIQCNNVEMTGRQSPGLPEGSPLSPLEIQRQSEVGTLVSVVVPCKNDARYLPSAIDSILSQDYPFLECIVVDGGSTDGTFEVLKRYGDRIRWISESDRGSFDAINRGWRISKGEILAWLNADDVWLPGAARIAVETFERNPEADVVFGTAGVIDEAGRVHGDLVPDTWNLEHALRNCLHIIYQPASFMRRRILEKVAWLYPAWCHDHDLWLRIARAGGKFEKISARLAMDRMRSENLGHLATIVIPAKIGLTRRFFAERHLPPDIRRLRRRAMSNAYLRGIDYLQIRQAGHWFWAAQLIVQAMIADPLNIRAIGERATRPLRWNYGRQPGMSRILNPRMLVRAIGTRLLRLIGAPLRASKRQLGRIVHRVFLRGNQELMAKIDNLQWRVAATEETISAAIGAVDGRIDNVSVALPLLTDRLESLEHQHQVRIADIERAINEDRVAVAEALESLRRQQEALQKELLAAQERPPNLSNALIEVYGTPPALHAIPGWTTYWGVENGSDPFLQARAQMWSSLKRPVLMRWLADLLVMIWPGNELSRVLFLTGTFEPNELTWMSRTLAKGMTMIDIGAHMGMYTMIASKLVGESGVVVALEPSSREFQRLTFHVTINDLRNVRCLQAAASGACGEATLKVAWEWNSGHNTFGEFFNTDVEMVREERVVTQTVDSLVSAQRLDRVDVIKIDVEGHELQVLAGAVETLRRFRPRILIEVFGETLRRQDTSVEAVLDFLTAHGYALNEFSDMNGCLVALAQQHSSQSQNLVALPIESGST